jgi:hypothetical protein
LQALVVDNIAALCAFGQDGGFHGCELINGKRDAFMQLLKFPEFIHEDACLAG